MIKRIYLILFLIISNLPIHAQIINGLVISDKNEPILAANIFIKDSYDGTISDTTGRFSFKTSLTGQQTLVVSFVGFKNFETVLTLEKGKEYDIKAILVENSTQLGGVYITAGTFEAGDKKRGIQLKAMDILTTANSNGDIYSALNTMPGAQIVGEEGILFVRGGEKNESKTFVDGMLVSNPYTSKLPDMPMRGRFSPSLFSGVQFSSGGYSAEYGQALSSALILQTHPFPSKTFTSFSLMPFGGGINQTIKGDSSSIFGSFNYHNMKPYFSTIPQKTDWTKEPEGADVTLMYRKKLKNQGLIKTFFSGSYSKSGLVLPEYLAYNGSRNLSLNNTNFYINSVYNGKAFGVLNLKTGLAFNFDNENIDFNEFAVYTKNRYAEYRFTLQFGVTSRIIIKTGGEFSGQFYRQEYLQRDSSMQYNSKFNNILTASFVESEWTISERLFARIGVRFESLSLNNDHFLSPRISMAYKTGAYSQISAAYGIFSQLPRDEYIRFAPKLASERATHYILNYQYTRNNRMFRVEGYIKDYNKLVRYSELNDPDPSHYNNGGYGYARGVELFYRDQKSIRNSDFWLSYTYLDTRKLYQDLSSLTTPSLFSKHSATAVSKFFIAKINSQIGLTYQYASGRPYEIPDEGGYRQSYTKDFNELSVNYSFLTSLFGYFTVIHVSVNNILGADHIYGYHYIKNTSGNDYTVYPIKPAAKRFFVLAVFITLDKQYIQY